MLDGRPCCSKQALFYSCEDILKGDSVESSSFVNRALLHCTKADVASLAAFHRGASEPKTVSSSKQIAPNSLSS